MSEQDCEALCPVCSELLLDARTLECRHTFCSNCLVGLALEASDRNATPLCPLCRRPAAITTEDVERLPPDNHRIALAQAHTYRDPDEYAGQVEDDVCLLHNAEYNFYCASCTEQPFKCCVCAEFEVAVNPEHELLSFNQGRDALINQVLDLSGQIQEKRQHAGMFLCSIRTEMEKLERESTAIEKSIDEKFTSFLGEIDEIELLAQGKLRLLYERQIAETEEIESEIKILSENMKTALDLYAQTDPSDTSTRLEIEVEIEALANHPIALAPPMRPVSILIPRLISLPMTSSEARSWITFKDEHRHSDTASILVTAPASVKMPMVQSLSLCQKIVAGSIPDSGTCLIRVDDLSSITLYNASLALIRQIRFQDIDAIMAVAFCHSQQTLAMLTQNRLPHQKLLLSVYRLPAAETSRPGDLIHSVDITDIVPEFLVDMDHSSTLAIDWRGHVHLLSRHLKCLHRFGLAVTAARRSPSFVKISTIDLDTCNQIVEWLSVESDGDRLYMAGITQDSCELQIRSLRGDIVRVIGFGKNLSSFGLFGSDTYTLIDQEKESLLIHDADGILIDSIYFKGITHAAPVGGVIYVSVIREGQTMILRYDPTNPQAS